MALDGVFLNQVKNELKDAVVGARVDKIYQPSREEIVLQMRTKNGVKKILISTSAGMARVHLTKMDIENPKIPPMFCMLLRKHLSSGRLVDITQDGLERILYFKFEATNELADKVLLTLAVEIMGRHSNLILINEQNKVIDSIKRVGQDMSSVRVVLPNIDYSLPPRDKKLSILEFNKYDFFEKLDDYKELRLSKAIMKTLEGISPVFAREAEFYSCKGENLFTKDMDDDQKDRLVFYLKNISKSLNENKNKYYIIIDKNGVLKDFCFTEINQYSASMFTREMNSACELLDVYFYERDLKNRIKQRSDDLFKYILNLSDRISKRIVVQKEELFATKDREKNKTMGDLISSNIYRIEKGMSEIEVENFYDENCPIVKIKLDKRYTPSQNAQKYYKEYKKADVAEKKLTALIKQGEEEIVYVDSVFDALTRATTDAEISEIRLELKEQGYLKASKIKGKQPKALPPIKFISSDGFVILVGRNNKQNDKLSLKDSEKTDIWLHTHNITGSHVIIVCNNQVPPDKTIEEAAIIAAYHSKSKNGVKVPVDYTKVKFVKKPVGSKPGMVIFTNNTTILVNPSEDVVENLKVK